MSNQQVLSESEKYNSNQKENKEKIPFFEFLMYSAKSEIPRNELRLTFYWFGIYEILIYLLCLCLFFAKSYQLWVLLLFIFHVVRAIFGFFVLRNLPKSEKIIDKIENVEILEDIYNEIIKEYKNFLKKKKLK